MPTTSIDWPAIRAKFETGISQRTLAREFGVSQAAISKQAAKNHWVISPLFKVITDNLTDNIPQPSDNQEPDTSAAAIAVQARYVIAQAMQHMRQQGLTGGLLDPNEGHKALKLLMDSLSQAHKIELTSSSDKPTASGIAADLLPYLDNEQLAELARLRDLTDDVLEVARAKKLEAEQGIKTIHKRTG